MGFLGNKENERRSISLSLQNRILAMVKEICGQKVYIYDLKIMFGNRFYS